MSVRRIKAGTADVSVVLRIVDSTDGTPETGVVFDTAGIDLWYRREGAASVDITEATLAALTTAHTDGGFLAIGDGWYRLDLPDAACASGVSGVQIGGTVTGMVVLAPYIELEVNTAEDVYTRLGAPAGASVSADVAAVKAETATIDANVDSILVDTGTDLPATLVTIAGYIDTEVAAIKAVTDLLPDAGALTSLATAAAQTTITTHLTDIKGATWASTDSLEAIRDRGDAAWITATGFSTLDAAGVRTAVGLASANLDTQLAALPTAVENATAVWGASLTELSADPGASPAASGAVLLPYMAIRNKRDTTATSDEIHNNAGSVILQASVGDDGTVFTKAKYTVP